MPIRQTKGPKLSRRHLLGAGLAAGALGLTGLSQPAAALSDDESHLTFFRIGTGPSSETLYSLGTAISAGISRPPGSSPCDEGGVCGVPGLIAVAQSREGSVANIRDIRDRNLESALVHSDVAYWAFNGGDPFNNGGVPELRVIADLIPVSLHLVVRADSGIASPRDLRDKVVSYGPRSSSIPRFADTILRSNGLSMDDTHPLHLQPGPAADRLISGEVDAFFDMGSAPIEAVDELTDEAGIRLLPLDDGTVRTLLQFYPFLTPATIPADVYKGIPETPTVKLGVSWVVHEAMDAKLIENVTRALWQSPTAATFDLNNPRLRFPTVQEGIPRGFLPIHPGAEAYYKTLAET